MGTEVEMKWGEQSMCVVKNGRELVHGVCLRRGGALCPDAKPCTLLVTA